MTFLKSVNDESSGPWLAGRLRERAGTCRRGLFVLVLAGTETSDVEGISAAGATGADRRMTPAVDADALYYGSARAGGALPVSPAGIVSPVVITRAVVSLLPLDVRIFDAGSFCPPVAPCTVLSRTPARCVSTGRALEPEQAAILLAEGRRWGQALAGAFDYVVLAECVPGGTTTAMGVLAALGYQTRGMLSSSLVASDLSARERLVADGIARSPHIAPGGPASPMAAVAAVGDPMQPFVAGFAMEASRETAVILAGGSQMLAVWALVRSLGAAVPPNLIVCTTKWVAFDRAAQVARLARSVGARMLAACPDFNLSRHQGMRAYEQGHVKEGVGAGAAMVLAELVAGMDERQLVSAVDAEYEQMVQLPTSACPDLSGF